jgi:thiamine-phosphate pyrophosphorylase
MSAVPTPGLPRLLVLTDGEQTGARTLLSTLRLAIDGGARGVVLREKRSTTAERRALAATLRAWLAEVDGVLLVASDLTIEADGVHLAATDPFPTDRPALVGRSCHDLADVRRAAAEGCDYATLSPVFATRSKPGYGPALGLAGLRDVVDDFELGSDTPGRHPGPGGRPMPIYARRHRRRHGRRLLPRAPPACGHGSDDALDPSATATPALGHDCDCGQPDVIPGRRRRRHARRGAVPTRPTGSSGRSTDEHRPSRSPSPGPTPGAAPASRLTCAPSPRSVCTAPAPSRRSPRRTPARSAACGPPTPGSCATRSRPCSTTCLSPR